MNSARLFSILAAVIAVMAILAVLLFMREVPPPQSESPQTDSQTSPTRQAAIPVDKESAEPDLNVTHRLSREDIAPLYSALKKRIDEYRTAHVRTRLEFQIVEDKRPLEAEFWFDAIRPDRYIHKTVKSMPKNKKSMSSPLVPLPYMTEIYDGSRMNIINYGKRTVYTVDLAATDASAKQLAATMLVKCATHLANPLQDLLIGVSYEDRLKEMVEAKQVSTSHGKETHILFRITGEMSQRIQNGPLGGNLPVTKEGLGLMALRKDVFDSSSGNLIKTVYLDAEWRPFLTQTYQEIDWDEEIPDDRFLSDAPPGSVTHNISERVSRLRKLGITNKDIEEFRRAGHPDSASSILELQRLREREKGLEPSN